jgi:hypothetical protein
MSDHGASFAGKRGRGWAWAASWAVPIMMGAAYCVLIATSDVGASGASWEAGGFVLVLGVWFAFRMLTHRAALARAITVGDHQRILELAKSPTDIAVAYELRGDWPAVLRTLDAAQPRTGPEHVIAAALRIHALIATGEIARAREVLDREVEPRTPQLDPRLHATARARAQLARGRVLAAEGRAADADAVLQRLIDDVRAGETMRAAAQQIRSGR